MRVPACFYVNQNLETLTFEELKAAYERKVAGFLPAVQQLANVAALPGKLPTQYIPYCRRDRQIIEFNKISIIFDRLFVSHIHTI